MDEWRKIPRVLFLGASSVCGNPQEHEVYPAAVAADIAANEAPKRSNVGYNEDTTKRSYHQTRRRDNALVTASA